MKLSSAVQASWGALAGNRDRDRRPCEGSSKASGTRTVASARTASPSCDRKPLGGAGVRLVCAIFMPDTDCASSQAQLQWLPNAYAMISCSVGPGAEWFHVRRLAARNTLMMGTDRSSRSFRMILFLFALLGTPLASRSATLEDSAKELARKIAASLAARSEVTIEVQNLLSVPAVEMANVERALYEELKSRGMRISFDEATVHVRVTLSENIKGLVWSAEIRQENSSPIVLFVLAKPLDYSTASGALPLVLNSEKFWEGPEYILDAAIVTAPNTERWLVLLFPEGLSFRNLNGGSAAIVSLESSQTKTRSPVGALLSAETSLKVRLDPNICTVVLDPPSVRDCQASPNAGTPDLIPGRGQHTEIRSECRAGSQVLASGNGDFTEPDAVQALEWQNRLPVAVSNAVDFPGPVSFHAVSLGEGTSATAIVRNLRTGNYEAYRLSISCSK